MEPEPETKDDCVFLANLAKDAGRYRDAIEYMRKAWILVSSGGIFTAEEIDLIVTSYDLMLQKIEAELDLVYKSQKKTGNQHHEDLIEQYAFTVRRQRGEFHATFLDYFLEPLDDDVYKRIQSEPDMWSYKDFRRVDERKGERKRERPREMDYEDIGNKVSVISSAIDQDFVPEVTPEEREAEKAEKAERVFVGRG